jgi:hypothetical protein
MQDGSCILIKTDKLVETFLRNKELIATEVELVANKYKELDEVIINAFKILAIRKVKTL